MEMTDKAKSRLYALTSIACGVWLIQAVMKAVEQGQFWSYLNLIFYFSMLIVISYTSYSAYELWKLEKKSEKK
ncbi:MAG: hypothetical protein ACK5LM_05290 [Lactovum sp.]